MSGGVVAAVEPGSIAKALEIRPGDILTEINGHSLRDVLDVQFYAAEEELDLLILRGEREILYSIERDYDVPLGLDFTSATFDRIRRCHNRCEFCFVAQMAPGLRRTLYVRDDDYRYSVLYGSFVTLTNLTAEDWIRLEEQRLSPLYVSVQATDPALRRQLLGREEIPDLLPQLERLGELGIEVHAQVVLIPGVNDGPHLLRTLTDLTELHPTVRSIGLVPVGLTRYHRGGCRPYTPQEARAVLEQLAPQQTDYRARTGVTLVYLADEWYLLAGVEVPPDEMYDDYPQIENGIGLARQFLRDSAQVRAAGRSAQVPRCTLACGTLIAPLIIECAQRLAAACGVRIEIVPVANRLFGETVTVSGLLGGEDVVAALRERELGEIVFLPSAMFATLPVRSASDEEQAFTLDGLTLHDLEERLGRRVVAAGRMSELWKTLTERGQRGDR